MKFAIIKERKNPPDRRVVFSPKKLAEARDLYPQAEFIVESSDIRIFSDDAYKDLGFTVTDDVSDADVMIGVKEVPVETIKEVIKESVQQNRSSENPSIRPTNRPIQ